MAAGKPRKETAGLLDLRGLHARFLAACRERDYRFQGKDGDFKKLAEATGLNIGTISKAVKNGFTPKLSAEQVLQLAKGLKIRVGWLIENEGTMEARPRTAQEAALDEIASVVNSLGRGVVVGGVAKKAPDDKSGDPGERDDTDGARLAGKRGDRRR
jgi:transcriptional regulator with XRE-family HTH domain